MGQLEALINGTCERPALTDMVNLITIKRIIFNILYIPTNFYDYEAMIMKKKLQCLFLEKSHKPDKVDCY